MLAIYSLAKVQTALDNLKSPLQLSDFICHRHHAVKFSLKMPHILQTLCGIRNHLHLPDQTDRLELPTAGLWAVQDVCCSFYIACESHREHTVLLSLALSVKKFSFFSPRAGDLVTFSLVTKTWNPSQHHYC